LRAIQEGNSCLLSTGALDTVQCTTGHFPVQISFLFWRNRPLKIWSRWRMDTVWCTPDSLVPPSDRWPGHASRADCAADRWLTGQSGAPPDSPVIFSRTPPTKSREQPFHQSQPGAPNTVRCTTGQSGAPRLSRVLAALAKSFPFVFSLILALRQIC
jgi:hypothetical protein